VARALEMCARFSFQGKTWHPYYFMLNRMRTIVKAAQA
jgi:hypothetical protein